MFCSIVCPHRFCVRRRCQYLASLRGCRYGLPLAIGRGCRIWHPYNPAFAQSTSAPRQTVREKHFLCATKLVPQSEHVGLHCAAAPYKVLSQCGRLFLQGLGVQRPRRANLLGGHRVANRLGGAGRCWLYSTSASHTYLFSHSQGHFQPVGRIFKGQSTTICGGPRRPEVEPMNQSSKVPRARYFAACVWLQAHTALAFSGDRPSELDCTTSQSSPARPVVTPSHRYASHGCLSHGCRRVAMVPVHCR
jgi:hypothetical protein